ncbi:MAG TPA: DUF732 domain-containing protein [Mycobacterium sp.]|nr:DUF732 domain-containing protein [Mycobacterium sp.]
MTIGLAGPAYANGGGAPPGGPTGDKGPDINSEAAQSVLSAMRAAGIRYTRPDQVVAAAEAVCKLAGDGKSGPEIVTNLANNNPGLTEDDAAKFVAIAERSYCPPQPAPSDTQPADHPAE